MLDRLRLSIAAVPMVTTAVLAQDAVDSTARGGVKGLIDRVEALEARADTLGTLSCASGDVLIFDGAAWTCGDLPPELPVGEICPSGYALLGFDDSAGLVCQPPPEACSEFVPDADLRGCDLSGRDLSGLDIRRAKLGGADLRDADLRNANLSHADLAGADLSGADASNAVLTGANLASAIMVAAVLEGANLQNARLSSANLQNALLSSADMRNADLSFADLSRSNSTNGTDFRGADLSGASLLEATLTAPNMSSAIARGTDFSGASVFGSGVTADLRFIDMTGANLSFATFFQVNMSSAKLAGVIIDFTGLVEADLRYALLVAAEQNGMLELAFANLLGATIVANMSSMFVMYNNAVCPDGTNSSDDDDDGFTCVNNLDATP